MEKSGYLLRERKTKTYQVDFSDDDVDEFDDDVDQPTSSVYCTSRKRKRKSKQQMDEIDPDFNEGDFSSPSQNRQKQILQRNNGLNNASNNFGGRFVHIEPAPFVRVESKQTPKILLKCVVDGCDGRLKSNPTRFAQVFPFPLSPVLLYLWKKAVKKKHLIWAPGPGDGVCANHFAPNDKPWLGDAPSQNLPSNLPSLPQLTRMAFPMTSNINNFRLPVPKDQSMVRPRFNSPASLAMFRPSANTTNAINNINDLLINLNNVNNNGCRKPLSPLKAYDPRPFLRPSAPNGSSRMSSPALLPNMFQNVFTIVVNARPFETAPQSTFSKPKDISEPVEIDSSGINDAILPGISVDYGDDEDEDEKDEDNKPLSTYAIDNKDSKLGTKKDMDENLDVRINEKLEDQPNEETDNCKETDVFAAITVSYEDEGNANDAGSDDDKASDSTVSARSDGPG